MTTTSEVGDVIPSSYSVEKMKKVMFAALVAVHRPFPPNDWSHFNDVIEDSGKDGSNRDASSPVSSGTIPTAALTALTPELYASDAATPASTSFEPQTLAEKEKFQQRRLNFLAEVATATLEQSEKPENDIVARQRIPSRLHQQTEDIAPLLNDVIFGKGGRLKHPGNEIFRAECQRLAPRFLAKPTSTVKHEVAIEVVRLVHSRGGRFLMEDRDKRGVWKIAGNDLACKKARQLLADAKKKSASEGSKRVKS
jgi:hypothetical protein